jgi:hypothetical protein
LVAIISYQNPSDFVVINKLILKFTEKKTQTANIKTEEKQKQRTDTTINEGMDKEKCAVYAFISIHTMKYY